MAFGIDDAITAATSLIKDGIDKIWPNPTEEAAAKVALLKATADAALAQTAQQMSVIIADSQSKDPWTSRARPSFLYVMYALILCCVPMGVISAFNPAIADRIIAGFGHTLSAIPDQLWQAFWICFTGYAASRTFEKVKGVSK